MKQLFIVGVGRSGTSLLQSMIAAHPQVAMLPETGFFRRYCLAGKSFPFDQLHSLYDSDVRLQRISRECWTGLTNGIPPRRDGRFSSWELYRRLLSRELVACVAQKDQSVIQLAGDKDPRLIEYLPLLSRLFPNSHFVHIVRDPRDVVASKGKAAWSARRDWRGNLAAGVFQLHLADQFAPQIGTARYRVIRYEDLLTDPEKVLRELTLALDIEYDPAMLSFSDAASQLSGGTIEPWKKETLGPLLTGNTGKWKEVLSRRQIITTEAATRKWMLRYGYEQVSPPSVCGLCDRLMYGAGAMLYWLYRRHANVRVARSTQRPAFSFLTDTIQYAVDHPRSTETGIGAGDRSRSSNRMVQRYLSRHGVVGMIVYWVFMLRGRPLRYDRWNDFVLADHASGVVNNSLRRVRQGRGIEVQQLIVSRAQLIGQLFFLFVPTVRAHLDVRPRQAEWTAMAHVVFHVAAGRVVMEKFRPLALLLALTSDRKRIGLGIAASERGVPIALYVLDRYGVIRHLTFRPQHLLCYTDRQAREYQHYAKNTVVMPSSVFPIRSVPSQPRIGVLLNARCDVQAVRTFLERLVSDYPHGPVLVRPHPGFHTTRLHAVDGTVMSDWREPLDHFLRQIDIAFAPNSNVIIDSLLHGVPPVYVYTIDPIAYDEHHFVADGIVIPYDRVTHFPDDVNAFYRSDAFISIWTDVGYRSDPEPERKAIEQLLGKRL